MKPVLLIAANFLREHRWPVLILFAWIVLTALAAGGFGRDRVAPDDVVFYVQQQAVYICVFSAFLAAGAIHNERKSRRILLVLSKAMSRGQYLLAVILGTWAVALAYALLFGLCGIWLTARAALPSARSVVDGDTGDRGFPHRRDRRHVLLDVLQSLCGDGAGARPFLRARNSACSTSSVVPLVARACPSCWTWCTSTFVRSGA